MTLVVITVVAIILFLLAFISKRRFGTLGLALAAGALLAANLSSWLGIQIARSDFDTGSLSAKSAAIILLTLVPATVLLFSGPAYTKKSHAVVGAVAFALMGTVLLAGPLSAGLPADTLSRDVMLFISRNNDWLLVIAIFGAVIDAWLTHTIKPLRRSKKHE